MSNFIEYRLRPVNPYFIKPNFVTDFFWLCFLAHLVTVVISVMITKDIVIGLITGVAISWLERILFKRFNRTYQRTTFAWKRTLRKAKENVEKFYSTKAAIDYFRVAYSVGILPIYSEFKLDISNKEDKKEIQREIRKFEKRTF